MALFSDEYAQSVDEVMRFGGVGSVMRTQDQTEIALFWTDGAGTYTPPGHWNQIAVDVSRIYGGIHFSFDNTVGLAAGRDLGDFVVRHYLQPKTSENKN